MNQRRVIQKRIMNLTVRERPKLPSGVKHIDNRVQEWDLSRADFRTCLGMSQVQRVYHCRRSLTPMRDESLIRFLWIRGYHFLTDFFVRGFYPLTICLTKQCQKRIVIL